MKQRLCLLLACMSLIACHPNHPGRLSQPASLAGAPAVLHLLSTGQKQVLHAATRLKQSFKNAGTVVFPFQDGGRTRWTFLPTGMSPRMGVSLGKMSNTQKIYLHQLLSKVLSSQGYLKTTHIMGLDQLLKEHFNKPKMNWSYDQYYFSFWGLPSATKPWGFKFEGHHLSLNFTFSDMQFSATPLFLGTNPAQVSSTRYAGLRVLGQEEDLGFKLINALTDKQRGIALLKRAVPRNILTIAGSKDRLKKYWGIRGDQLNVSQQKILFQLICEYVQNLQPEMSQQQLKKISANHLDDVYFSWIGQTKNTDTYYYLIHSPRFVIEFDNNHNHVHSIWRVKGSHFGEDILRNHLKNSPHHQHATRSHPRTK